MLDEKIRAVSEHGAAVGAVRADGRITMSTGSDARVSESILASSKEALCSSLALLSELSLFNLLFQKSAD